MATAVAENPPVVKSTSEQRLETAYVDARVDDFAGRRKRSLFSSGALKNVGFTTAAAGGFTLLASPAAIGGLGAAAVLATLGGAALVTGVAVTTIGVLKGIINKREKP